jgi:hypothetical protein
MGGGGVSAPKPTPEETALRAAELQMVHYQQGIMESTDRQQQMLMGAWLKEMGYDYRQEVRTSNGVSRNEIIDVRKRFDKTEELHKRFEEETAERSLQALRGELPVDPGLEKDLAQQREALQQKLASQFGTGYATTSPAIEALQRYDESANILREGARTGQLTLSEQLNMSREQQGEFKQGSSMDFLRQSLMGDPMTVAGGYGQVANQYLKAQQPYIQDRQMQLQASIANAQAKSSMFGAGIGAIGSLFSDEDIKGDLVKIADHPIGVPVYMYTRKDTGERMIGVLAQDVYKVMPHAVGIRDGYLTVDYRELE